MAEVRTFLYAVGDDRLDECKYGFQTAPNEQAATAQVTSRYRSVYRLFVLHQLVPVPMRGRDAEAQLKEQLAPYWDRNELLVFPDRLSMHWLLGSAYAALACPEEQAYVKISSNAVRIGAQAAAERRAKRRADQVAIEEERKRRDEAWSAEQAARAAAEEAKRQDAEERRCARDNAALRRWLTVAFSRGSQEDFVLLTDVHRLLLAAGFFEGPRKLKRILDDVWGPETYVKEYWLAGTRYNSAYISMRSAKVT